MSDKEWGTSKGGIAVPVDSGFSFDGFRADGFGGGGLYGSSFGAGNTGWTNPASGMGTQGMDKQNETYYNYFRYTLNYQTLENLYNFDDLSAIICDTRPEAALKKDIEVDDDDSRWLLDDLEEYDIYSLFKDAGSQGRLFGGCAVVMILDDGNTPDTPLEVEKVRGILDLAVYDRYYLNPIDYFDDPSTTFYGQPKNYMLEDGRIFHRSRLIRFYGRTLPRRQMINNYWWGGSYVDLAWDSLRQYQGTLGDMRHTMTESSIPVLKSPNLSQVNAMGGSVAANSQARLNRMNHTKSAYRMMHLDGAEEFEFVSRQFAGIADIHDRFATRVATSMRMTELELFGKPPAGLNASLAEQLELGNDRTTEYQRSTLTKPMNAIINILAAIRGKEPPKWNWAPLKVETETERSTTRLTNAQAYQLEKDALELTGEEMRMLAKENGEVFANIKDEPELPPMPVDNEFDDIPPVDEEIPVGDDIARGQLIRYCRHS